MEQVEVKAPGSPNRIILPVPSISLILLIFGSPFTRWKISVSGILSFIFIVSLVVSFKLIIDLEQLIIDY